MDRMNTQAHTHTFNGPLSRITHVSRYQKGKTNLDFTGARDSEWQWHQLDHMHDCTSLQTDNHASTPPLSFFTGRMPFLPPNQQRQSTEGTMNKQAIKHQLTDEQNGMCSIVFMPFQKKKILTNKDEALIQSTLTQLQMSITKQL